MTSIRLFKNKMNSNISRDSSKLWRKKNNRWRKSGRLRKRHSRITKTERQPIKFPEWKNSSSNSLKRPRSKSKLSTINKSKSESCMNSISSSRKRCGKFKINWKRRSLTVRKSASRPLLNSRKRSSSYKIKELKSRKKVTRKSEALKEKERI